MDADSFCAPLVSWLTVKGLFLKPYISFLRKFSTKLALESIDSDQRGVYGECWYAAKNIDQRLIGE